MHQGSSGNFVQGELSLKKPWWLRLPGQPKISKTLGPSCQIFAAVDPALGNRPCLCYCETGSLESSDDPVRRNIGEPGDTLSRVVYPHSACQCAPSGTTRDSARQWRYYRSLKPTKRRVSRGLSQWPALHFPPRCPLNPLTDRGPCPSNPRVRNSGYLPSPGCRHRVASGPTVLSLPPFASLSFPTQDSSPSEAPAGTLLVRFSRSHLVTPSQISY